jgi:hypothetical protein
MSWTDEEAYQHDSAAREHYAEREEHAQALEAARVRVFELAKEMAFWIERGCHISKQSVLARDLPDAIADYEALTKEER